MILDENLFENNEPITLNPAQKKLLWDRLDMAEIYYNSPEHKWHSLDTCIDLEWQLKYNGDADYPYTLYMPGYGEWDDITLDLYNDVINTTESLKEELSSDILTMLKAAYDGSYYTIEGAGGSLEDWKNGIQGLLDKENIGTVKEWITFKGSDMNEFGKLTGNNAYPDDLTFLAFPLDNLDGGKLAMFKLKMGDRWFDDIVDNNARREGYHPFDGSHYEDEELDENLNTFITNPKDLQTYEFDKDGYHYSMQYDAKDKKYGYQKSKDGKSEMGNVYPKDIKSFIGLTEGKNLDDIIYDKLSRIKLSKGKDGKPRHPEVYANPKGNGFKLELDDEVGIDQAIKIAKEHGLNYSVKKIRDYIEVTIDTPERKVFTEAFNNKEELKNALLNIKYVSKVEFDTNIEDELGELIVLVHIDDSINDVKGSQYFKERSKTEHSILNAIKSNGYKLDDPIEDNGTYLYYVLSKLKSTVESFTDPVPYNVSIEAAQSMVDTAIEKFGRIGAGLMDDLDELGFYVVEEDGKYIVHEKFDDLKESFELDTNEYDKIRNSKINPGQDLHTIYHVNTLEDAWDFMQYGFKHGFNAWYAVFTQGSDGSFVRDFRAGPDEDYLDNAIEFCKNYSEPVRLEYIVADPTGKEIAYINIFENTNLDESYKVVDKDGNKVPQGGGFTSKKEAEMFAVQYGEKDLKVVKESFENEHPCHVSVLINCKDNNSDYSYNQVFEIPQSICDKFKSNNTDEKNSAIDFINNEIWTHAKSLFGECSFSNYEIVDTIMENVQETPEPGPEAGIASIVNKLIIDEWEAIQGYNDAIVAAETEGYSDIANVLRDIANEENLHVGQLEQCMQQLSPNTESINQGEVEAETQLTNELVTESVDNTTSKEDFLEISEDDLNKIVETLPKQYQDKINEITDEYKEWSISCTSPSACKKLNELLSADLDTDIEIGRYGAYISISKEQTDKFALALKQLSNSTDNKILRR